MKKALKKRLSNKLFLAAAAGLVYKGLQEAGVTINLGTYQLLVDVVVYTAIGAGVYSSFDK